MEDIIEKAFRHYGHTNQLDKLLEELAELTLECHRVRNQESFKIFGEISGNMLEEMVDVYIMIEQFRLNNELSFHRMLQNKITSLDIRIKNNS